MTEHGPVIDWLLQSDPAIRWQVMRDLLDRPEIEWKAERAKVETGGWGAQLLSHQDEDGQWAGAAFWPPQYTPEDFRRDGQAWTATAFSLQQLMDFGLDPGSENARRSVALIGQNSRWEEGGQLFWDGEVEECINARTVTCGCYFGVDVSPIVSRLLGERQADGGWNCERCNGSERSSYDTTINVLEALLAYEKVSGGSPAIRAARATGEEYLLKRGLFRRLSTGAPADDRFLKLLYPHRWRYDVLRGLEYFRAASLQTGQPFDPRLTEPLEYLLSRRSADGRWPLDWQLRGPVWFTMEETGAPSRWVTLKAMRVLRWWETVRF